MNTTLLNHPHFLLPILLNMLLRTNTRLLKRQRKDLNENYFVQFCQLCREE